MSLQGAALPLSTLVPLQDASSQQYTFLKALQPQNTKFPSVGLPPSQAFAPLLAYNCFKHGLNTPKLQPWRQPGLLMEQEWKQSALLRPHKKNTGLLVKRPRAWARSAWFHQGTRGSLGGLSRKLRNGLSLGCNTEDEHRKSCGAFCSHSHWHQQPSQPKDSLKQPSAFLTFIRSTRPWPDTSSPLHQSFMGCQGQKLGHPEPFGFAETE